MKGFRRLMCGLAIAGLLCGAAPVGSASAATIDWTLETTNLQNGGIWGYVTVSGSLTTSTTSTQTSSSIQITEYAGFMDQSVSGPINGPGYSYTYDTGIPCVLAGCTGDIIGYVDFTLSPPIGDTQQYLGAFLNDSGRDFSGNILATPSVPGTPEPATWALMLLGFVALGHRGYRRMSCARPASGMNLA
jgi:hypothetical protein